MTRAAMSARAFSLLEVMVASAVGLILLTIIVAVFGNVQQISMRGRQQAGLEREAAFAGRLIAQDLRQAGLGVPSGGHIERTCGGGGGCVPVYGTVAPARFYASVIVAAPDQVGIVADLVRPNAQYNTFGPLSSYRTGGTTNIAWHTENNGLCMPPACSTATTSLFFAGESGCRASAADRTCPWGMNRVQPGDRIQIVAGNGNWSHAAASSPLGLVNITGTAALDLSVAFDRAGVDNVWRNTNVDGAGPGGIPGAGWVTTLDRVFYRKNADVLERIQCWGDPDPDNAGWPDAAATAVPGAPEITPSTAGATVARNVCTPAEVVARFVESFQVQYFDATGGQLAPPVVGARKAAIHRIDFQLTLRRSSTGKRDIVKSAVGSVRLANIP